MQDPLKQKGCHDSVKIVSKNSLMGEIQKLQDERTSDLNQHHTDESYIHRLLQTTDFCSRVVLNQVKEVMMDSVHDIKRFEEPALS